MKPLEEVEMLARIEPRAFLFDFRRDLEEMFDRFMPGWSAVREAKQAWELPIETWTDSKDKTFHVRVAVPGIDPKDVKVEVHGNVLTITGERKGEETKEGRNYSHREFTYGSFGRVVTLPEGVAADTVTAEFNQGILVIRAPIATAALPRRIEIKPILHKAA
jgi:HSP20 family protein